MEYPDKESLKSRYENYSDEEILQILEKRKSYQKSAVEVAVEIALSRGIINSEVEFLEDKLVETKKMSFQLFPKLNSEEQVQKVIKSLARVLYLTTVFPLIYCVLSYVSGELSNAAIYAVVTILWATLVYTIEKKQKPVAGYFLVFIFLSVVIYTITSIGTLAGYSIVDWIVLLLSVILVLYCILYIQNLLSSIGRD